MVLIKASSDTEYFGAVVEISDTQIVLQPEFGGRVQIERSQIVSMKMINPNDWKVLLGGRLGYPAGLNLALAASSANLRYGVEGFYIPTIWGINADVTYFIHNFRKFRHGLSINLGYTTVSKTDFEPTENSWLYIGPSYYFAWKAVDISVGITMGIGPRTNPQLFLSLGYMDSLFE